MRFHEVTAKITELGGRLSGSRARGDARPDSDWDFWLSERKVKVYKRWLDANREEWDSPFMGAITCWPEGVQVEVSYLFPRRPPFRV